MFLVKKLPKYYVKVCLLFLLSKARQAKWRFNVKKITKPKWQKTKNEVTKICNEPGIKYTCFPEIPLPELEFNLKLLVPIQPLSIQPQLWPLHMAIIQPIFLQRIYHMQGTFLFFSQLTQNIKKKLLPSSLTRDS